MSEEAARVYSNKEFLKNRNYLFISYTHTDKVTVVNPVLKKLSSEGVNFWYDTELRTGDDWFEEVQQVICNDCCVGAVIFLSEESILKTTIYDEVKLLNAKAKDGNFKIAIVFIGYNSHNAYMMDYYKHLDQGKNDGGCDTREFLELFKSGRRLYLDGSDEAYIKEVVKFSVEQNANEKEVTFRGNFERWSKIYKQVDGYYCHLYEYEYKNSKKIVSWKLIDKQNDILTFVSCRAVDFVQVNDIDKGIIRPLSRELEKYPGFIRAGVLCEEHISRYGGRLGDSLPEDEADANRNDQPLRLYFVSSGAGMDFYELYNSQNVKISKGKYKQVCDLIKTNYKCGVRLFMEFDDKLIN